MFFKQIKTPGIAHNAYLIGDEGRAAIVDPRRDVEEYLTLARENDLTVDYVIETHRQEDFVLGSSEIKRITGAQIVTGAHPLFGNVSDIKLNDDQELRLGGLKIRALTTPGHTPESMSYAIYLADEAPDAWGVFTGDALFIGETGRTDLPDPKKTAENAGILFDSIHKKIAPLGGQTLLFPAHGSGSVCGGNIADRDLSSIGLEKATNAVFRMSREQFCNLKVQEQIPRPPYFTLMEKLNLLGGLPLPFSIHDVPSLQPKDFQKAAQQGIVIDTRLPETFAGSHIPGSYSIWLPGLPVFAGWVANQTTRVFLLVDHSSDVNSAILHLLRIGIDKIEGVLAGGFETWRDQGFPIVSGKTISPESLSHRSTEFAVLDVREISEFDEKHIAGSENVYVGDLIADSRSLPSRLRQRIKLVVTCSVGHRASLAMSALQRRGVEEVYNLLGGMTAWSNLKLPVEHAPQPKDSNADKK